MDTAEFRKNLENDKDIKSEKAIKSRVSRLHNIEVKFNVIVDEAIKNDESMVIALSIIKNSGVTRPDNYTNALRKYYLYVNGKKFPKGK